MRWRLKRASLSPEEAGLCGCWYLTAVWRERKELRWGEVTEQSEEYSNYSTSAAPKQYSAQQSLQSITSPAPSDCRYDAHSISYTVLPS